MKKRPTPQHPGDMLKAARLQLGYNKNVITARLGITKDVLNAIEQWQLDQLPENPHLIPILKRHAKLVEVSYNDMVHSFPEALRRTAVQQAGDRTRVALNNSLVVSSVVKYFLAGVAVLTLAVYVLYQTSSLGSRPDLIVVQPEKAQISETTYVVSGQTGADSQVYVNGSSTLVDDDGSFATEVVVKDGVNQITVTAVNRVGAERTETIVLVKQ